MGRPLWDKPMEKLYVDIALGKFEEAEECAEIFLNKIGWWTGSNWDEEHKIIRESVLPLLRARDRAGLAALLHGWEAITVKKLGLEKYWQPTPFPLELA